MKKTFYEEKELVDLAQEQLWEVSVLPGLRIKLECNSTLHSECILIKP